MTVFATVDAGGGGWLMEGLRWSGDNAGIVDGQCVSEAEVGCGDGWDSDMPHAERDGRWSDADWGWDFTERVLLRGTGTGHRDCMRVWGLHVVWWNRVVRWAPA